MHWPALDFAADGETYLSAHLYLQLIGKLPTRLLPWENHGWHVAMKVTPCGFATRTIALPGKAFSVELDCEASQVLVHSTGAAVQAIPLAGQSVAALHGALTQALGDMGLPAPLHGAPNELPDVVPFAEDDRERAWDADAIRRAHAAFASADAVFNRFRAAYLGKSSPSHLFWGSFDLAVTRFSGRRAPPHPGGFPNLPDRVTREAYSHEVISAGFWLGGGGVDEAAFYAYAYPSPDGLKEGRVSPETAYWHGDLGEFVLPYADVAAADDPEDRLLTFLETTYEAAARLMDWPADRTTQRAAIGSPTQSIPAPQ